jgi:hypothetical protein
VFSVYKGNSAQRGAIPIPIPIPLVSAVVLTLTACHGSGERLSRPVPDTFRAVTLTDDTLERHTLAGRAWVMTTWRAGCEKCLTQLKVLDTVKGRVDGVSFVALSIDTDEDAVIDAAGHAEIDSTLAIGGADAERALGLHVLPTTVVIDEDATVIAKLEGEHDAAAIEKWARAARR